MCSIFLDHLSYGDTGDLGKYFGSKVGLNLGKSVTLHKNTERQTQPSTLAFTPLGRLGFSVSLASFGLWEEKLGNLEGTHAEKRGWQAKRPHRIPRK